MTAYDTQDLTDISDLPPPEDGDAGERTKVLSGDQETLQNELKKAKEQEACLIVIRGTPQGHRFFLTAPELTLGRDVQADISLSDQGISRKHAVIKKAGSKILISDLGSANGTSVNDRKLQKGEQLELRKEDMIKMGNTILKFLPAGELEIIFYGNLGDQAHMDPLTGCFNKRYLMEALEAEFKRAKALHSDLSLLFFDIDHFKKVNDTYGHDAGDFILKEFSTLIKAGFLRPKDVLARYGGEEFIILMGGTSGKHAMDLAEKVRAAIETHPFIYEGTRIPITTSLGVAELATGVESTQTLLKAADKALYSAKQSGRNRVVFASI
jgi:diguanylate cyclase (GGDEF)-like protein